MSPGEGCVSRGGICPPALPSGRRLEQPGAHARRRSNEEAGPSDAAENETENTLENATENATENTTENAIGNDRDSDRDSD